MGMDIRFPIGLMFSTFGLLLTGFGAFSNRAIYEKSLGININIGWGLVLLAFGLVMLVFGRRAGLVAERAAQADLANKVAKGGAE